MENIAFENYIPAIDVFFLRLATGLAEALRFLAFVGGRLPWRPSLPCGL